MEKLVASNPQTLKTQSPSDGLLTVTAFLPALVMLGIVPICRCAVLFQIWSCAPLEPICVTSQEKTYFPVGRLTSMEFS